MVSLPAYDVDLARFKSRLPPTPMHEFGPTYTVPLREPVSPEPASPEPTRRTHRGLVSSLGVSDRSPTPAETVSGDLPVQPCFEGPTTPPPTPLGGTIATFLPGSRQSLGPYLLTPRTRGVL